MKDLTPFLNKLADSLGTTTAHVWQVMSHQAFIYSSVWCLGIIGFTLIAWRLNKSFTEAIEKAKKEENKEDRTVAGMLYALFMAAFLSGCGLIIYNGMSIITGFLNPQYWALQRILEAVK